MRILAVEDEGKLAGALKQGMEEQCGAVDVARDGQEALHLALGTDYDCVILDLMLPRRKAPTFAGR